MSQIPIKPKPKAKVPRKMYGPKEIGQLRGLEKVPYHPTGFGISHTSKDLMLTFLWEPPERPERYVHFRVVFDFAEAEDLANSILRTLTRHREATRR